jgi:phosphoribosylformylglycinamidine synthase
MSDARGAMGLPPEPTDVELECIAQTWSEHCFHKIFRAGVRYTDEHGREAYIDGLFDTFIRGATRTIARERDWLVSVFKDNAGVIRFNEDLHVAFKVETHNSPSALDPYGGAMTGIVGCNRDPMGTGMGCAMLCNTWGYCLGSPFYDGALPEGLFHPRRIRDGVHQGVIDGGNQSGIP